jgi:hypothetical protein
MLWELPVLVAPCRTARWFELSPKPLNLEGLVHVAALGRAQPV